MRSILAVLIQLGLLAGTAAGQSGTGVPRGTGVPPVIHGQVEDSPWRDAHATTESGTGVPPVIHGQVEDSPWQDAHATVAELEQRVRNEPASLAAKADLAEAYLRDCQLEKSLKLWQAILAADPDHPRAKLVVTRLTAQALDLDSHLAVLDSLIQRGVTDAGMESLLAAARERAATDSQKAWIVYLQGHVAMATDGGQAAGLACYESAIRLYPSTSGAARSAIGLADYEARARPDEARRLLNSVIDDKTLADEPVRQHARVALVRMNAADLAPAERLAALRDLADKLTDNAVRRDLLGEVLARTYSLHGRPTPEAVAVVEQLLATKPNYEQTGLILRQLQTIVRESQDPATLDKALAVLGQARPVEAAHQREAEFIAVGALLARAVVETGPEAVRGFLTQARQRLDRLAPDAAAYADRSRIGQLRGQSLLVEAQKLAVLQGPQQALPILLAARDHYLSSLAGEPAECFARLARIGLLLEQLGEWETAIEFYRGLAGRFPHLPAGRDALLRAAQIYDQHLDAPMVALRTYIEYAARYPAELPYRQLAIGERLRRLGYANVLDFQKRNNLKSDGALGPQSRARLEQLEASFDLIRAPAAVPPLPLGEGRGEGAPQAARSQPGAAVPHPISDEPILRGQYVHQAIFAIAARLDRAGQHRDAIVAYRAFLNLFPSKKEADNCLISVARLFRANLLFAEALAAYRQLIDEFPKGDMTSQAYIEAAQCLENLGRWKEARELYGLYGKSFPKYEHAELCKARIALLDQVVQYEDFVRTNPANPKVAEAQYQIASILYKQFNNYTKAAVEFAKVAEKHPQHVRAADALFTAATAQLKAENFPAARKLFAEIVEKYSESRLADDGQYWIGHTYEYAARALGKLGEERVVLRRRSLKGRAELAADAGLRRAFGTTQPGAAEAPAASGTWGGDTLGVLTSGSIRDRVNADLFEAIRAYRAVVDRFKAGDMAGNALLRIGTIYTEFLSDPDKGVAAYQELLEHYPGSKEAVDALFEVGAYQITQNKFDEAIKSYQQFIYNYQNDPKVEEAMLAIARCHSEKKSWDKALDAYQSYLNKFPGGKRAEFARSQVEWIRMYHF